MNLNTADQAINLTFQEALSRVSLLNRIIPDLRNELAAERANSPACQQDIELKITQYQLNLDKLEAKLSKEKQAVKKRKKEIDEWKNWYNSNPNIDKSEARAKLDVEIFWRGQEIAAHELEISSLLSERLSAMGMLENSKLKLEAFRQGFHKLPIEDDPRLVEANAALAEAKTVLQALQSTNESI